LPPTKALLSGSVNGALADMSLATDPFTGNRYTFAAGNPVTNIELDGYMFPGSGGCPTSGCNPAPASTTPPAPSSGGCSGFFGCALHDIASVGAGAVNGITSIFTAPAANVAAGYAQAAGGLACGSYTAGCDPSQGAGLAARFQQVGAHPVPIGDPSSGAYKGGYYGAPLLLGGAGGIGKLREILAAENADMGALRAAAQERADELQSLLPKGSQGRTTMGVGIGRDAQGALRTIIGTNEPNGYLRPGVSLAPGEELTRLNS